MPVNSVDGNGSTGGSSRDMLITPPKMGAAVLRKTSTAQLAQRAIAQLAQFREVKNLFRSKVVA